MGENLVGLFHGEDDAQAAAHELRSAGFGEAQVSLIAKNTQAAVEAIERREIQSEETIQPEAAVGVQQDQLAAAQPGGMYMIVRAHSEDQARRALDVMSRYNVVEVEHRAQEYLEGTWQPIDEAAAAGSDTAPMQSRTV
ncbi:MAG TPA: hypothetical protein VFZ66_20685 [Herpetosiphonaceae bacterium]